MATLLKPPSPVFDKRGICASIFLAGSIEMGKAEDWQTKLWKSVKDIPGLGVLNPRRDDWNDKWEQKIENAKFREQVEWELVGLESVDMVVFYFDPKTQSSITLFELGLVSHRLNNFKPKVVVCCPQPYFRKGNIDINCKRYGHKMVDSLENLIKEIKTEFSYLDKLDKDFDLESCSIGWNKG